MAGKGDKDNRIKDRKQYHTNFDSIKRRKEIQGFQVGKKGKLTKKY
jgi:hypothetical protein